MNKRSKFWNVFFFGMTALFLSSALMGCGQDPSGLVDAPPYIPGAPASESQVVATMANDSVTIIKTVYSGVGQ